MDAIVRSLVSGVLPVRRYPDSAYEIAVSLAGPWSDQFFHWFVEYLPRLITVEKYAEQFSLNPVYIVPANPPKWLSRSLELFGIQDNKIITWNGKRAKIQDFLLPSLWRDTESTAPKQGYIHSPRGIREVSNRLLKSVSEESVKTDVGSRIYISRSRAPTRNVVNENKLRPVLNDYEFELVRPETWSLDEQIATFGNAEVIAGPHGGGLTNAMYASNPTVMEFFGRNTNPCYFALFAGSGWDYGLVNGKAVGSNIRVAPDDFRQLCEQMLD
jgi:capsular polysaccharide biosynthesis protein